MQRLPLVCSRSPWKLDISPEPGIGPSAVTGPRRQKGQGRAATATSPTPYTLGADETPAGAHSSSRFGTSGDPCGCAWATRVNNLQSIVICFILQPFLFAYYSCHLHTLHLDGTFGLGAPVFTTLLMPSNHNRDDKPWDTEDIDKWKVSSPHLSQHPLAPPATHLCVQIDIFTPTDNLAGAFAEESSFGNC